MTPSASITAYLAQVPKEHIGMLKEMRALTKKLIPDGAESIKYGMPTIELAGKNFIHYAAMKGHLGFYPTPSGVHAYEAELKKKGYEYSKGCIRLSYNKPLPTALITKIITFRKKDIGVK